ncbi:ribosomal protein l32 [Colletotrichum higginsianum]|uniref:DUF7730 domain-containing protein n=1 Tax=Colletotrichum higginsianum TaxID=80884 RepID=A0A4T0W358_9PEZI|nr:hypothetical protein CH35J_006216 [Colletotrichum higginsianum]GJC93260.1 ribosomal protein l32 [Colletotrichum higginsianum]
MPTLTLTIRPDFPLPPRPRRRGILFMQLPREVRDQIYEYSLVEPQRHEISHESGCFYKSTQSLRWEPPAFLLKNVVICENPYRLVTESACDCDKRKCISLLLANRQIHAEAAPVFWSQNTFCFLSAFEVIVALRHNLRHQYRNLVTEICVMSPADNGAPLHVSLDRSIPNDACPTDWPLFWHTICNCAGLRTLQISPGMMWANAERFARMFRKCRLLHIVLITLFPLYNRSLEPVEYPSCAYSTMHYCTIYVMLSHGRYSRQAPDSMPDSDYDLGADAKDWMDVAYECFLEVDEVNLHIRQEYLDARYHRRPASSHASSEDGESWFYSFTLSRGGLISQEKYELSWVSQTGIDYHVRLYGLPPSSRQARQATKERFIREKEQRALNGMTDAEAESKKESLQLKKEKREELEEKRQAISEQNRRQPDPNVGWVDPEVAKRQMKKSAEKEVRKSQKENEEMRRMERKRVQS